MPDLTLPNSSDLNTEHLVLIDRAPIEGSFHAICYQCGWDRYHSYGTSMGEVWRCHDERDKGQPE